TAMPDLPATLTSVWEQLRGLISLAESTLNALRHANADGWRILIFVYLLHCLSVRMAPLPGRALNHIGAVAGLAAIGALAGTVSPWLPEAILRSWPVLALTTGWLMLALLVSLAIKGIVSGWQLAKGRWRGRLSTQDRGSRAPR